MSGADIAIIGGGPAGSAAAAWAAEAGARVILLERTAGPHDKVCGEFVSVEAVGLLRGLGLDLEGLGAVPIDRVRLVGGGRAAQSPLPFPAMSLSRRVLDEAMLELAASRGTELRRGVAARGVEVAPDGVRILLSDGGEVTARTLFLATGKHELRGMARGPGIQTGMIGLKMHLALDPAQAADLAGATELLLFPGGYAGLQPVDGNRANLCLLVRRERYQRLDRCWPRLMAELAAGSPLWRARMAGARELWQRPLSIYGVPYGHVAPEEVGPVYRLGDQMAVIPSFAGDGIAIALRSARLAVDAWAEAQGTGGDGAANYHLAAARRFAGVRLAARAARAMEGPHLQRAVLAAASRLPRLLSWAAARTRLAHDANHSGRDRAAL